MKKTFKNSASQLVMGLSLSCISVMINSGIANQIVLAKTANPVKCDIFAYVTEKDPQGLNVRSGASTRNKILGTVPTNETVKIIAVLGNWVKIINASDGFKGTGWVSVLKLGISTRGYGSNGVNLYANANQQSKKVGRVSPDVNVNLLGCQSNWAWVEYQGVKGWLKKEDQCGAALTSCS
ncbi:SH3 domain-containing protein [Cylindrospermum sp. FACHB-282]|uniref:SH3 domain-containing protein n=1 Tax=Cylindrospermum sp. FACHB-282 TaxID=2692794 RepID=UPI00168623C7|nr:SH3 domain-containing protein [Cylindrospermum sp. FACHB-282]MBD2384201.1 SH3 domain-containing protein [Cylindrospermum sp. FACHB-282]